MSLQKLSSDELLRKTEGLVQDERRITLALIEHLREIERRMAYSDLGYGSLHDFCRKHLGLSEGSAHRRISAMRLVRDLPEAKEELEAGTLSLSNATKLQMVFQAARRRNQLLTRAKKRQILEKVKGLSQRECESELFRALPEAMGDTLQETERLIGERTYEVKLIVGAELHQKIERLKALLSHSLPDGSTLHLLERLVESELARQEKRLGLKDQPEPSAEISPSTETTPAKNEIHPAAGRNEGETTPLATPLAASQTELPELSLMAKKKAVWRRAREKCEIPGCGSTYQLQIDHIVPRSKGGDDSLENLRLICRTHNLHHARNTIGEEIMKEYVSSLR